MTSAATSWLPAAALPVRPGQLARVHPDIDLRSAHPAAGDGSLAERRTLGVRGAGNGCGLPGIIDEPGSLAGRRISPMAGRHMASCAVSAAGNNTAACTRLGLRPPAPARRHVDGTKRVVLGRAPQWSSPIVHRGRSDLGSSSSGDPRPVATVSTA